MRALMIVQRVADIDGLKKRSDIRRAKELLRDATKSTCSKCNQPVYIAKASTVASVAFDIDSMTLICMRCLA